MLAVISASACASQVRTYDISEGLPQNSATASSTLESHDRQICAFAEIASGEMYLGSDAGITRMREDGRDDCVVLSHRDADLGFTFSALGSDRRNNCAFSTGWKATTATGSKPGRGVLSRCTLPQVLA